MATQYSNKPIVTDGLVYALDFGNPKSYVSGSTTANSLKYDLTGGSVLTVGGAEIPDLVDGLLKMVATTSTTGSYVTVGKLFSEIVPTGEFTIQLVVSPNATMFMTQGTSNTRLISNLTTTSGMFGWYLSPVPYGEGTLYKTKTAAINSGLQHLTYRYSSGSYDLFINGVPSHIISRGETTSGNTDNFRINGRSNQTQLNTQDLGNFYLYNRALTSDEIYSNYLIQAQRYGLPKTPKPYSIDENAYLFLSQSGITDPIITGSIDTFVRGLKANNLWDKMIAIYPFVGTGSAGVNLTGSHSWNLKDPTTAYYKLAFTGSWNGSTSGSTPSGSNTAINTGVLPYEYYPFKSDSNQHISILSYDTPVSSSYLMGTGMTEDLAVSTLAGDYGTPAAAYSVRKVRTAYSGALMDVRRSYDNTTGSIGYVSNGDLDTGALLDWVVPGRSTLPGTYSGLAAAYSLRRVSASYSGFAIDVRRDSDNTTSSIGFNAAGNLDTGTLLAFVTGSANTGSGFVTQWYDQSGNGRHATQTATGSQPLIVSSGSLITENGKPAVRFIGTNLTRLDSTTGWDYTTTFTTTRFYTQPGFAYIYNSGVNKLLSDVNGSGYRIFAGGTTLSSNTNPSLTNQDSIYTLFSGSSSQIQIDNNTLITGSIGVVTANGVTIGIASNNVPDSAFDGTMQELLFYSNDQSANRPLIENNINNYYNIYTGSNHGFVARWYDQSGNNNHAIQTATGSQPLIVLSGSVLSSGTRPSLFWSDAGTSNLEFSRISNIQTVFHISQLATTTSQSFLLGDTTYVDYHAGTSDPQTWFSFNPPEAIRSSTTNYINGINLNLDWNSGVYRTLNRNLITLIHTSAIGRANRISEDRNLGFGRTWRGYIQEITLYTGSQVSNRQAIEYNINNYYNIYPQTSSFATSSFTIKVDSGSISASLNNRLTSGIAASGPLGLITVSRTGSNSLTIARNGVTSSFSVPASGALSTGLYLGAINNNGIAVGNSPVNISFASVGTGLTGTETVTFNNLVGNMTLTLRRLVTDLDAYNFLSTAGVYGIPEQIAINTLVTDLKSYEIWNKMKVIYPFVGQSGVSSSFEFNLKDPNTFRGTFTSGWTFASNGATPNGTNAYMNTNFSPSNSVYDNFSWGYYLNTDITQQSSEFGVNNATAFIYDYPKFDTAGYTRYASGERTVSSVGNSLGFYTWNQQSNTLKRFKNGSLTNTISNTPSNISTVTLNYFIAARNDNGTPSNFSSRRRTFHFMSDGLTDTEAANFYTAVQRFQTTLGRQV